MGWGETGLYLQGQRTLRALHTHCHGCHMMGGSRTCSHVQTPVSQDGNTYLSPLDLTGTQNFKIKIKFQKHGKEKTLPSPRNQKLGEICLVLQKGAERT